MTSASPRQGSILQTLTSSPELKLRVWHLTDRATQAPPNRSLEGFQLCNISPLQPRPKLQHKTTMISILTSCSGVRDGGR